MKILLKSGFFLCFLFLLSSCKEDEPVIVEVPIETPAAETSKVDISGFVQKGPFINGTSITVAELDDSLSATGKIFLAQVANNQGRFATEQIALASQYIQLMATGFYFDEVQGEKSSAPLTLYALAHIADTTTVNVNLLSHLTRDRILYLYKQDKSFAEAKWQAQQEVLAIFGIIKEDVKSAELLDIAQDGEDNAILLAVSAILQANNTVAELSELLANIITDIKEDGKLDSETQQKKLRQQAMSLNLSNIKSHLLKRYEEIGVKANIPNFEKYVDSDGDGILNKDEDDTPDEFAFAIQKDVAIDVATLSNEVTIAGIKEGGASEATVSHASLFINGNLVKDSLAQVRNGDKLKLQVLSSSQYADTVVASLSIGYLTSYFTVVTDDYKADNFNFIAQKDVAVDSFYTSNTITVSGLPYATPASVENGILIKNGVVLNTDTTSVKNGDKLAVKLLSSDQYFSKASARLVINGIAAAFDLTTDDYKPDDFNFTAIENAKRDSLYISNTITLSGLPHPTPISIDQGKLFINGKELKATQASVKSGDQIAVKLTSSADYETTVNSFVNVGAASYKFNISSSLSPWQRKADGPNEWILEHFYIDEKVYVIGGETMNLYQYDVNKDQWTTLSKFPGSKRRGTILFIVSDKVYFGLGESSDGSTKFYQDLWEYNIESNSWAQKADFPGENQSDAVALAIKGKGYICTGHNVDEYFYDFSKQLWEYNPDSDQWTQKADFPGEGRGGAMGFVQNGKGYVGAGHDISAFAYEDLWEYNPDTNSWIEKSYIYEQLFPIYHNSFTLFDINNTIYVMNFFNNENTVLKKYDPDQELWIEIYGWRDTKKIIYPDRMISGKTKAYSFLYYGDLNAAQLWEFTPPSK